MAGFHRTWVSLILALSLVITPTMSSLAGTAALSRTDYEACQARDETAFRAAITQITSEALRRETRTIDYASSVAIEWRRLNLDALIDNRVDEAVAAVRDETSWGRLLQSLASQEQAQKLATAVAERVYQSADMRKAIESLVAGVGRDVGARIELASQDATGPALDCLKAFVGPRYGSMISNAVTMDAGDDLQITSNSGGPDVGAGAVLKNSTSGITGATLLIVRRQMANMARRIGQRIAGSILSRLVSVVAGGVGVVLIAKDVWDLRHGVLPIIAEQMKSKESKDQVRAEIASTVSRHINDHLDEISRGAADQVVDIWQTFRRAHTQALDLADRKPKFRAFLDDVRPERLAHLDEVIALLLEREGEAGVVTRLNNGTLETAVKRLPDEALTIARETRSVEDAIGWHAVASDQIPAVLKYELHKRTRPNAFSKNSLTRLLALDDRLAITRLAGLETGARETLYELEPAELQRLARALTESDLSVLATYLTGLKRATRTRVLAAVSEDPARLIPLKSAAVRDAVLASSDQKAAIDMLLREGMGSLEQIKGDFVMAWEGRIAPRLILAKHPLVLAILALGLVFVLLLLRRLFRPRGKTATASSTP